MKSVRPNFRYKFLIINNFKEHYLILMGQHWCIIVNKPNCKLMDIRIGDGTSPILIIGSDGWGIRRIFTEYSRSIHMYRLCVEAYTKGEAS